MPEITPTFFIGLGGTGHLFTTSVKRIVQEEHLHSEQSFPLCQYLVVDTEFVSIQTEETRNRQLNADEKKFLAAHGKADRSFETSTTSRIHEHEKIDISMLPSRLHELLHNPRQIGGEDFIPSSAASIKPGTFGASQIGLLGKIMGVAAFNEIRSKIDSVIARFTGGAIDSELRTAWPGYYRSPNSHVAVYISCSLGGGTGRGLCLLVASMVRAALTDISPKVAQETAIAVVNFMPDCFQLAGRKVLPETLAPIRANTYAAFKELEHVFSSEDATGRSGAIEMEPFFKHYYGRPVSNSWALRPIDSLLLLSPKLDGGGAKVQLDSYKQVNEIAARALTSIIFGGKEGPILSTLSNVRPPVTEAKTRSKRPCRYGRMGRGTLRYPVRRLQEYTRWYLGYHALLDLEDGHLSAPPQEHIDGIAGRQIESIKAHIAKAFASPEPITFTSLSIGEITFETPIVDELQAQFRSRLQAMKQNYDATEARLLNDGRTKQSYLGTQEELLRQRLTDLIEPHGITRSLLFVDKVLNYVNQFQISELRQLGLGTVAELDQQIAELDRAALEFADGTHPGFKSLQGSVHADRDAWARSKGFFHAVGVRPEPPKTVSDSTRERTSQLIVDFQRNTLRHLHEARRLKSQLVFFERYRELLKLSRQQLDAASRILTNKDKWGMDLGLVAQYESAMDHCARQPGDPTEIYVYGRNPAEFAAYCEKLPNRVAMLDAIQHELNMRIVPIIVDPNHVLRADVLREVLDSEVRRQVDRELADESITAHLQQLTLAGRTDEIDRLWTSLNQQSAWLGTTDGTRVQAEEADVKDFKLFTFVEMADPRALDTSEAARSYFHSAAKIENKELVETIVVSRYQFHMPLFVHDSVRDHLASDYERLVRSFPNNDDAQVALAKYHTSRQYFYLNEPFDRVSLIPEAEREHTLNLMLHLGIFSVDDEDFLQCLQPKKGREGFEMSRWLTDRYKVDRSQGVMFHTFVENPSQYAELTEYLLDRTTKLFAHMAKSRNLHELLDAYLGRYEPSERYPLVPETLLQNRLLPDKTFKTRFGMHATDYRRKLVVVNGSGDRPPCYSSTGHMVEDGYVDPEPIHRKLWQSDAPKNGSTIQTIPPGAFGAVVDEPGESQDTNSSAVGSSAQSSSMKVLEALGRLRREEVITEEILRTMMSKVLAPDYPPAQAELLLNKLEVLAGMFEDQTIPRTAYESFVQNVLGTRAS